MLTKLLLLNRLLITIVALIALILPRMSNVTAQDSSPANLFEDSSIQSVSPAVRQFGRYYRLGIEAYKCSEGIHVQKVDPNGPGARMLRLPGRDVLASLEAGDHITHVDGIAINSVDELVDRLSSNGGKVVLTVKDKNTRRSFDYETQAKNTSNQLQSDSIENNEAQPLQNHRKVVALLIGLSNDNTIGEGAKSNVERLSELLKSNLDDRVVVKKVLGGDCNAKSILDEISKLHVNSDDSLFAYYAGHGAYDVRYSANDPSGGHYFQIPSGDILRRTVTNALISKGARLTVMISDTCNVSSSVDNLYRREEQAVTMTSEDYLPIEKLFFFHSGFLDISGSSKGQYGWYQPTGGWFTDVFATHLVTSPTWDSFFSSSRDITEEVYKRKKGELMNANRSLVTPRVAELMRNQSTQRPFAFTKSITSERIPKTGNTYTVPTSFIVEIPDF
jgi:hypothetical protein